jgi:hypothetical protein
MNESPKPEPLAMDDLLAGLVPLPVNSGLQEALRKRTTGLVRRRRWLRRGGFATALAACYVAGLLTMNWLPSLRSLDPNSRSEHASEAATSGLGSGAGSGPEKMASDNASPLALEWQALESPSRSPALFRAAGDRYLTETGDVGSAVRCYRKLLEEEGGAEPTISSDDSWLLMALKEAKQREKRYAKNDG